MKKIILILLLVAGLLQNNEASAQTPDSVSFIDVDIQKNMTIYHFAMGFNDPTVARIALYNILFYSNDRSAVLDSLAMHYYNLNMMPSVALVTKENLIINPNNEVALELGGIALNKLGAKDQALANYEKLFLKNNDSRTLYQIASLHLELKRLKEASTSADILIKRSNLNEIKITFFKLDQTNQEVSMRSAVLNLKGLIAEEEGNIQLAKEYYLEALKSTPSFELAQLNLSKVGK